MAYPDGYSYDLDTTAGLIRLNTFRDLDSTNPLFLDVELAALYLQERSNVKRTAARILELVATQEVWIQKVIKLLQLSTNGPALSAAYLAQAKELRAQADQEEALLVGGSFDIAETVYDDFSLRRVLWNETLRRS